MISETGASAIYFALLAISLICIKLYVDLAHVFLYVLLLICLINYSYVVSYAPKLKNVYVAVVGIIPVLIASSLTNGGKSAAAVAPALFLFLIGREVLMDVQDSTGDPNTLAASIGTAKSEIIGFGVKLSGSSVLAAAIRSLPDAMTVGIILVTDCVFWLLWRSPQYRRIVIHAMKLQLLLGIYYLAT